MSIGRWVDKETVVHIHSGMVHIHSYKKKKNIWVSFSEVDETGAYYTEQSKPKRETPIQHMNAYSWNLERL